ncbi:cupin [Lichenicoccus roseus]|uniref:cupin n=1 Tax=Lichenicoccus roseus TaxID=2683649 RepID=UPI001F10B318|nr:cupin [Lichenicoccus roseus]
MSEVEHFLLGPGGWVPNNARLPVLLYRAAISPADGDPARAFESRFEANGWPPQWRNGVYPFHHYHSTAHEVLGFAAGSARLQLGGPNGRTVRVQAGDAVLLPAGTGHCNLGSSADFLVIGAYPAGQDWDTRRDAPDPAELERMQALPVPDQDPVQGRAGASARLWHPA